MSSFLVDQDAESIAFLNNAADMIIDKVNNKITDAGADPNVCAPFNFALQELVKAHDIGDTESEEYLEDIALRLLSKGADLNAVGQQWSANQELHGMRQAVMA